MFLPCRPTHVPIHTCAHVLPDLSVHGDVWGGLCMCYVGGPACMAAHRGLHERGHGCACTCVERCACRRAGLCVSVRVNTGTLRGLEAGCAGGAPLSGWGGFYSFQGWRGRQGLCVWLSGYPARSSRPGSLFPPPAQPRPGTPLYLGINHGREEGPKILCRLEARETWMERRWPPA